MSENSKTPPPTAEQERLRFEGDLDKWMKIIGAGITGSQPEAYAMMDLACQELVKLRAMFSYLNENAALELVWQEVNGDPSECGWHLFRRFGGRSDRDFKIAGTGETVEEAIKHAMDGGGMGRFTNESPCCEACALNYSISPEATACPKCKGKGPCDFCGGTGLRSEHDKPW